MTMLHDESTYLTLATMGKNEPSVQAGPGEFSSECLPGCGARFTTWFVAALSAIGQPRYDMQRAG